MALKDHLSKSIGGKILDRKALYSISYGLYIVSSKNGNRINGQIANTVFQITSEPVSIAVSINKENLTHEFIERSGAFSISVLSEESTMDLIAKFGFKSGRTLDKFQDVNYRLTPKGLPIILDSTLSYFEANVINQIDAGTHSIFHSLVTDAGILAEGEPMTYAYYHKIKGGRSPKTAPTYNVEKKFEEAVNMKNENGLKKYICTLCGYVYDPAEGDPEADIAPNTSFEDLPDDWVCPICGAGKEEFEVQD